MGLDHVSVLGKTIEEIAWQKAGIYKVGLLLLATVPALNVARQEKVPALTVEQPEEGMTVLKRVAEEKKVGSAWVSYSDFRLILCKASSFSVVERIHEMDKIKLGEGGLRNLLDQITLIPIFRTRRFSPIPKCRAGRGALPGVLEISSWPRFRRGSTRAFQTGSGKDSLAGTMPNRSGSCLSSDHVVFGRGSYARESRVFHQVVRRPGYGVEGKVGLRSVSPR